jgi:hypothetical protein
MTRRGVIAPAVLILVLGAATLLLAEAQRHHGQRQREIGQRQARIQAREFAVAAAHLGLAQPLTLGAWTIMRAGATVTVSGPLGSLSCTGDQERWQVRP